MKKKVNKRKRKHGIPNIPGSIRIGILSLICIAMTFTLCSCVQGASGIQNKPGIKITAPVNNVPAGDVKVMVDVSNFNLVDKEGKQNNMGEGHIIYYLDVPVPTHYDHQAITERDTYMVEPGTSFTWKNVTPGQHTFSVQLVNNNNKPLPAPAVDSVTITIEAPEGNPGLIIQTPQDGSDLPPGIIIIVARVSNFVISKKDMGVLNRNGEGHLIYYIDEDPPTDPNTPAVTETSIVSADLSHLWKSVTEGQHTFSVQLVNNDDTPLKTPVIEKVTLNITP